MNAKPKPSLDSNEAELIHRVGEGDKDAFYCLVRPCDRGVFTAAMSILNNPLMRKKSPKRLS